MCTRLVALIALAAQGCKGDQPPAGSGSSGSGSVVAVVDAAVVDAKPACDLAGTYRVRIHWDGPKKYWLRFRVDGTPPVATLTAEQRMLALTGRLDTRADTTACRLSLVDRAGKHDEASIILDVDPATNLVTGQLYRANFKSSTKRITGLRDTVPQTTAPADACFEPGVYRISFDPNRQWVPDDPHECEDSAKRVEDVFVRLEWLGTELVLEVGEKSAPWREALMTEETFKRGNACEVELQVNLGRFELAGKLKFAPGGKVTGVGKEAKYVLSQGMDIDANLLSGDVWYCRTRNIPLTITRVASF